MKTTINGPDRPTLTLPYVNIEAGRTRRKNAPDPEILPQHELRRIVMEMLG